MIPLVLRDGERIWLNPRQIQAIVESTELDESGLPQLAIMVGGTWFQVQESSEELSELMERAILQGEMR
jgi:hypothetical protein